MLPITPNTRQDAIERISDLTGFDAEYAEELFNVVVDAVEASVDEDAGLTYDPYD
jgi:hypothetical protein